MGGPLVKFARSALSAATSPRATGEQEAVAASLSPFKSQALRRMQGAMGRHLRAVMLFSLFINVLSLSSSLYMMQVYDRVLPSQRTETLWLITLILVLALVALSGLEAVRGAILVRMGIRMDNAAAGQVFTAALDQAVAGYGQDQRAQAMRDFDAVRQFLTGGAVFAFIDAPWLPLFLAIIALLHPVLALVALAGVAILAAITWATEKQTAKVLKEASQGAMAAGLFGELAVRQREIVNGLHMRAAVAGAWRRQRGDMLRQQAWASDKTVVFSSASRFFRILMQSSMLCFGSYLVIRHELSAGGMVAASILLGRALSPVEQAVAGWKQFQATRDAFVRLDTLLAAQPQARRVTELPAPEGVLALERVSFALRDMPPIVKGLSLRLNPGECLSILGPSGSGKTTLAKLMVGALRPTAGIVRLDGADLANWEDGQLGSAIGYLAQDVEFLPGSVRDNIARFTQADDAHVVAAAKAANAHQLILGLPQGYDTPLLGGGLHLSGGQRQRIGLARALFGDPVVVVLDEPNAHLDSDGEQALAQTILELKRARRSVALVSHRPATLGLSDKVLVLRDGALEVMGPTAEVIEQFRRSREAAGTGAGA